MDVKECLREAEINKERSCMCMYSMCVYMCVTICGDKQMLVKMPDILSFPLTSTLPNKAWEEGYILKRFLDGVWRACVRMHLKGGHYHIYL